MAADKTMLETTVNEAIVWGWRAVHNISQKHTRARIGGFPGTGFLGGTPGPGLAMIKSNDAGVR